MKITIINIDKKHPELGDDRKMDFDIDDNWYNLYFLYMLTDDTEEEDLQATVNEMNNIDYEANLAFDVNEIV